MSQSPTTPPPAPPVSPSTLNGERPESDDGSGGTSSMDAATPPPRVNPVGAAVTDKSEESSKNASRFPWRKVDANKKKPYRPWSKRARYLKARLHMFIGLGIVVLLIVRVGYLFFANFGKLWSPDSQSRIDVVQTTTLGTVGIGLCVAAGIELAYTLFTDGPDEALDPVLLAVAGAIILQTSALDEFDLQKSFAMFVSVAALAGLFAIRKWIDVSRRKSNGSDEEQGHHREPGSDSGVTPPQA